MWIPAEDSTIDFCFNTSRFSTGAPFTLAGTPSIAIRVDGNATEITAGITLTVDFDSITGYHKVVVDLSASASYVAGARCEAFIAAGTVDSVSVVGKIIKEWIIGNTGSQVQANTRVMLALPAVAPAANGGLGTVDANNEMKIQDGTGAGQLDFTNGIVKSNMTQLGGNATGVTNLTTVYITDFAANYDTTGDCWFARLDNGVAHGGSTATFEVGSSTGNAFKISGSYTGGGVAANAALLIQHTAADQPVVAFDGQDDVSVINTTGNFTGRVNPIYDIVASATFGNAALKTLIDALPTIAGIWAAATRTLTAATNITSTGGTTVPQTGDTFALANGASGFVALKAVVDAILADTGTDGVVISSATRDAIATSLLDLAAGVETGITFRQFCRAVGAVVVGLLPSGAGTGTEAFKGIGQASGGTTRVTNTVDNDGNRTAQTLNL